MKLEVSKFCSQASLGSLGSQVSHRNGGLPTPRMDFLQQSCINRDLSISLSPTASNKNQTLDSLIESVCLSEVNTPEIDMDLEFINQLPFGEANIMSQFNCQLANCMDEDSDANCLATSPTFYSGDFTIGCPDPPIGEVLDELKSILNGEETPLKPSVDTAIFSPSDDFTSGSRTCSRSSSNVTLPSEDNGEDYHNKKIFDSLYQDIPLLPISEDILDESPFFPFNELADSTLPDSTISPESLDSIYDISDFDLSTINSSLDLFQSNVITQALQDVENNQLDHDCNFNDVVNSFLNTDDPSSNTKTDSSSSLEESTPINHPNDQITNQSDSILKAFAFTYGEEEKKPLILKNVKILTPRKTSLSSLQTQSFTSPPRVIPPSVVVKSEPLQTYLKKSASSSFSECSSSPRRRNSQRKVKLPSKTSFSNVTAHAGGISNPTLNKYVSSSTFTSRKKRSKMSLQGLSDAEKYLRIRSQNNLASKKCREKKKEQLNQMRLECEFQEKRHDMLTEEYLVLQQRRDRWKRLFFHCNS